MSEKIGGAKGTELDDEFVEMERVSHTLNAVNLLSDKLVKTEVLFNEYMHAHLFKNTGTNTNNTCILVPTFLYKVILLSSRNGFLSCLIENRCHGEVDR